MFYFYIQSESTTVNEAEKGVSCPCFLMFFISFNTNMHSEVHWVRSYVKVKVLLSLHIFYLLSSLGQTTDCWESNIFATIQQMVSVVSHRINFVSFSPDTYRLLNHFIFSVMAQSGNEGNLTSSSQVVMYISKLSFNEDLVFAIVQLIFCE